MVKCSLFCYSCYSSGERTVRDRVTRHTVPTSQNWPWYWLTSVTADGSIRFSVLHWFANEPAEVCWYWRSRGYSSKFGPQTVLDGSNTINPPTIGPVYAQHVLTALRVEQMVCVICDNSHNVIDFPGQNLHLYKWNLPTEFFLKQSWIVGKMTAARLVYYSSFA